MNISLNEAYVMVFKRVMRDNLGEFSLTSQMLKVIMELDGKKNLGTIAQKTGIKIGIIKEIISKLLKLELVEPVEGAIPILKDDFFDYLNTQLSLAVGPIAEILIDDAVSDLDHTLSHFPSCRAAELVDLLARQIQREEKMTRFKQNMVKKIKETDISNNRKKLS